MLEYFGKCPWHPAAALRPSNGHPQRSGRGQRRYGSSELKGRDFFRRKANQSRLRQHFPPDDKHKNNEQMQSQFSRHRQKTNMNIQKRRLEAKRKRRTRAHSIVEGNVAAQFKISSKQNQQNATLQFKNNSSSSKADIT